MCIQYTSFMTRDHIVNYSLLAAVVCVSGTSEVHFRGLSLKRSARGAGWVVCVCINAVLGFL